MSAEVIPLRPELRPPRARKKLGRAAERPYYFHQAFGRRLQYARRRLGITEAEAAAVYGITLRTYRRLEAGGPCRDHHKGFVNFAHTYGLSFDWLFGVCGALPPRFRLRAV